MPNQTLLSAENCGCAWPCVDRRVHPERSWSVIYRKEYRPVHDNSGSKYSFDVFRIPVSEIDRQTTAIIIADGHPRAGILNFKFLHKSMIISQGLLDRNIWRLGLISARGDTLAVPPVFHRDENYIFRISIGLIKLFQAVPGGVRFLWSKTEYHGFTRGMNHSNHSHE